MVISNRQSLISNRSTLNSQSIASGDARTITLNSQRRGRARGYRPYQLSTLNSQLSTL
ncbi:MAG: hypothetical protein ACRC62_35755 [Microcoleus sp.]